MWYPRAERANPRKDKLRRDQTSGGKVVGPLTGRDVRWFSQAGAGLELQAGSGCSVTGGVGIPQEARCPWGQKTFRIASHAE